MLVPVRPQFNHSRYIHHVYGGRGFGSMFGCLFAKVAGMAAKTGIRSALKVGTKIAQKGISTAARKGLTTAVQRTAKQVLKKTGNKILQKGLYTATRKGFTNALKSTDRQTLTKGIRVGKNVVKKQLKTLPKKVLNYAIKKSQDPETQHSVQKAITKGAREVVKHSDLNNYSAIRIVINAKDQLYHLHEGYLEVKGKVVQKADSAEFSTKSGIALIEFPTICAKR